MSIALRLAVVLTVFTTLYACAAKAQAPNDAEAEVRKEYDRLVASMAGKQEYRVRHILVATETQARAALGRIEGGEPFEAVAKEVSVDPGSRDRGGDLGWSLPEHFIEQFAQAMTSLAPRGLSKAPTRTRFGWHVIEVTEVRPVYIPPYEQVRDRIAQHLGQKAPIRALPGEAEQ